MGVSSFGFLSHHTVTSYDINVNGKLSKYKYYKLSTMGLKFKVSKSFEEIQIYFSLQSYLAGGRVRTRS